MIAVFIGPDDSQSCDGCSEAVESNPYDVEDVPEPGSFECMSRCRHMVQIQGDDIPDDMELMSWTGDFGFTDISTDEQAVALAGALDSNDVATTIDLVDAAMIDGSLADIVDTSDTQALAQLMVDTGIDIETLAAEADLTEEEIAALKAEIDGIIAGTTVDDMIAAGDVEMLTKALEDGAKLDEAITIGQDGLSDPQDAYTLRDALNSADEANTYVVTLEDDLWKVVSGTSDERQP